MKQAHLLWHKKLITDLEKLGFQELECTLCVFRENLGSVKQDIYILVYVDYFLVLAYTNVRMTETISSLQKVYEGRVFDSL